MTDSSLPFKTPGHAVAAQSALWHNHSALLGWLLGLWWLSAQYFSFLAHDGLLYTGEALRQLHPHAFDKDPFFMGQTQGNFSVFGPLYAHVVAALGLRPAGLLMSVLGRALWLLGAVLLALSLWRKHQAQSGETAQTSSVWLISLALMLLLPSAYDGYGLFAYGASEVTPRCWAEAAILLALAAQLRQRLVLAAGLGVLALSLHPLMALPGLGLLLMLQRPRVRNLGLGLGLLGLLVGTLLGIGPLSRLPQQFDPAWWNNVVAQTGYVLVDAWKPISLAKAGCWAVLLGYVSRVHTDAAVRRFARGVLVVLVLSIGGWWLACQTRNVLGVQLQMWRALWLAQLLAPALWASTLAPWRSWNAFTWTQVLLVLAAVLSPSVGIVWGVLVGLCLAHPKLIAALDSPLMRKVAPAAGGLALLMALGVRWPDYIYAEQTNHLKGLVYATSVALAAEPLWTLPATLALLMLAQRLGRLQFLIWLPALVPVALGLGVAQTQAQRASRPLDDASALRQIIPEGALVYWDSDVEHTWFRLQRAHYASLNQGPNALFVREAGMELHRRVRVLVKAGMLNTEASTTQSAEQQTPSSSMQELTGLLDALSRGKPRNLSANNIRTLCSDPVLDFVLLSTDIPETDFRVPYADTPGGVVSVFKCHP